MGVKRLKSYLRPQFRSVKLQTLEGKRVGIDGLGWLYKAFYSVSSDPSPHLLHLCLFRRLEAKFKTLQKFNISFIVVLDGQDLDCKRVALSRRTEKRSNFKRRAQENEDEDIEVVAALEKYAQDPGRELINLFIDYLDHKGYPFIVAPYEADAQLIYLYKTKKVDYIISEDSDFLAMSCFQLISDVKKEGWAIAFDETISHSSASKEAKDVWPSFSSLPAHRRLLLCIMSGCDYVENIKGVGFLTLLSFFVRHNQLKDDAFDSELVSFVTRRCGESSDNFMSQVRNAQATYTHQIVYNPDIERLVPLTPPPRGKDPSPFFVGAVFANAKAFANGEIDKETLSPRVKASIDFQAIFGFINYLPRENPIRLNNLCNEPFSYKEFIGKEKAEEDSDDEKELEDAKVGKKIRKLK